MCDQMIKKINVEQLKPGMFIHDLNSQWLKHPFFGSSVKVTSEKIIEKIIAYGIEEVFIDTDLGIDVLDSPLKDEVERKASRKIDDISRVRADKKKIVSIDEEIITAKKIKQEAVRTVQKIMTDIKLGKQIEKEKVEVLVDNIIDSVIRNQDALIALSKLRKINDYVHNHSMSVCVLMSTFAKHLGYDSGIIREIGVGAMLHDVGTARMPLEILNKTSELSEEEFEIIKKHVKYGRTLLEKTSGINDVIIEMAYQHHERLDGSGYPNGIKGDEISHFGKAIAIVDVYDALTSKQCYRRWITPTEALRVLYDRKGTEFDPDLVEKFIHCIGVYPVGSLLRLESGLLGFVVNHNEISMLEPVVRIVYDSNTESKISIPYDLDLSEGSKDRIVGYESPERFEIHAEAYI